MTQTLAVQPQHLDYYNYFVMCNYVFNAPEPVIENAYTYEENGVLYCASATQKGVYCYTYARNNPLMYTDPSGEFLQVLIPILAYATLCAVQGGVIGSINGAKGWQMAGYIAGGFIVGAASSAVGMGVGMAVGPAVSASINGFWGGMVTGALSGFAAGAVNGLGMGLLAGKRGGDLAASVGLSAFMGLGTGAVLGGITGGIYAKANGGDFWTGNGMTFTSDYPLPGQGNYEQGRKNAIGYQKSKDLMNTKDMRLGDLMVENIEDFILPKYYVDKLTTNPGDKLGLTTNGRAYVKPDGGFIGGRTETSFYDNGTVRTQTIRIAPGVVDGNILDFVAIAGHEWLHAQHYYTYGIRAVLFTETIARQYSYSVYNSNQRIIPYRPRF